MLRRGYSIPELSSSTAGWPAGADTDKSMKKLLILSLLVVPSLVAAETHRYIVATTRAPRLMKQIHVLSSAAQADARNVRTFDAIDGFAVDLTDAEAEEMRKSAGVRYVSRPIEIYPPPSVAPPPPLAPS